MLLFCQYDNVQPCCRSGMGSAYLQLIWNSKLNAMQQDLVTCNVVQRNSEVWGSFNDAMKITAVISVAGSICAAWLPLDGRSHRFANFCRATSEAVYYSCQTHRTIYHMIYLPTGNPNIHAVPLGSKNTSVMLHPNITIYIDITNCI
jgi:hypothetical protein